MAGYTRYDYDVLVIGAGGAGLRAAIEAAAAGVKVGLICKSLLGKAHTVMAEGGIAAALANVDDRDNWKVHFSDTMRGGQYVNNWRMAELHAKEAPARVRELEAWGAVFDRTPDGRILQRNFGGHRYPRLAHVGDRRGRADPLQDPRSTWRHGAHGVHDRRPVGRQRLADRRLQLRRSEAGFLSAKVVLPLVASAARIASRATAGKARKRPRARVSRRRGI
jgi:succinate dehydrogenase / fumarate reductase flavoprotein subunit